MKPFNFLAGKHQGKPILVLGGAPCLPGDLEKIDLGQFACVLSANYHACDLVNCDYIVALDKMRGEDDYGQWLKARYSQPVISVQPFADYKFEPVRMRLTNSGIKAIWVAHMMGGYPIVTAGFELYQGKYYFDDDRDTIQSKHKAPTYIEKWIGGVNDVVDGSHIRPVSNILTSYFKKYEQNEVLPPYNPPKEMMNLMAQEFKQVRFIRDYRVEGAKRLAGKVYWLSKSQAERVVRIKEAVWV